MIHDWSNGENNSGLGTIPKSTNSIISNEKKDNINQDAEEAADRFVLSFME